jgi:hypothetical protein
LTVADGGKYSVSFVSRDGGISLEEDFYRWGLRKSKVVDVGLMPLSHEVGGLPMVIENWYSGVVEVYVDNVNVRLSCRRLVEGHVVLDSCNVDRIVALKVSRKRVGRVLCT